MSEFRSESDSLGRVEVPAQRLWGAQTQRSLEHFDIGSERMPAALVDSYALIKKASARVNHREGRLAARQSDLIVRVCDELLAGRHREEFPLGVWMSGSGTPFNMNVNEVIANRCCQLAGTELGSKDPVHPNDHVNLSQSTNDTFPSAICIAAARETVSRLLPSLEALRDSLGAKALAWADIVKIGRTHLQDATPLTLGQEFSGYVGMLDDAAGRIRHSLGGILRLALGGTAVGTGINASPGFADAVAAEIASETNLPFVSAPNKFSVQGSHDDLVHHSASLKTLAASLYKIANDVRLLACGPRCGIGELRLPQNEPGSSIMPGKVNPTQCEALAMLSLQVIANDGAVTLGGASGILEMNVYKPLLAHNLLQSLRLLADGCRSFRAFLVEGMQPDRDRIRAFVERSLMLVTALSPIIGYDRASQVAHHALEHDLTLRDAALELGFVSAAEFDRVVDPARMVGPERPR